MLNKLDRTIFKKAALVIRKKFIVMTGIHQVKRRDLFIKALEKRGTLFRLLLIIQFTFRHGKKQFAQLLYIHIHNSNF